MPTVNISKKYYQIAKSLIDGKLNLTSIKAVVERALDYMEEQKYVESLEAD